MSSVGSSGSFPVRLEAGPEKAAAEAWPIHALTRSRHQQEPDEPFRWSRGVEAFSPGRDSVPFPLPRGLTKVRRSLRLATAATGCLRRSMVRRGSITRAVEVQTGARLARAGRFAAAFCQVSVTRADAHSLLFPAPALAAGGRSSNPHPERDRASRGQLMVSAPTAASRSAARAPREKRRLAQTGSSGRGHPRAG